MTALGNCVLCLVSYVKSVSANKRTKNAECRKYDKGKGKLWFVVGFSALTYEFVSGR